MRVSKQPAGAKRVCRRGIVLPVVLVGLLVVAMIGAAMARTVMLQRRSARHAEQRQQAAWLAESALLRAQMQLAKDDQYTGETWTVTAEQTQTRYAGTAVITVEPVDGAKRIVIEATYPEHLVRRILQHREKHVKLSSPGGSS